MGDKINIIVERDGKFHKFKFGNGDCKSCSLHPLPGFCIDACDVCIALHGNFEKVELNKAVSHTH